jgi:hypothetical protein
MTDETAAAGGGSRSAMQWEIGVSAVHPLLLGGYVKIFSITALIMGTLLSFLMAVSGSPDAILPILGMTLGITLGLFVLGVLGMMVVYRGGMIMRFTLNEGGARGQILDRRAAAVSTAAIVLGTLAGKPGAVGSGLIAKTTSDQRAAWKAIVKARYYPRWRAIALANSWRTVLVVFCPPERYEAVAERVRRSLAERPARASARKSPVRGLLLHTVLVTLATLPMFLLPHPVEIDLFAPLFTLCFALASVWLIPYLSVAVIGGVGWIAGHSVLALLDERRSMFSPNELYRAYEVADGDAWAALAFAGLGGAYLVWLSLALMRGRVVSGLAGDMDELENE